jgi:UDP-N-acetylmuramoyl-tripeptide--D-alanyl-D-alanine ligase
VTNVGPAHIGAFGTIEGIAEEKADLLRCLPPGGLAFLCSDDQNHDRLRKAATCGVVTVSARSPADYAADPRSTGEREVVVRERRTGESRTVRIPDFGEHHVVNTLFAVAVARSCGLTWDHIVEGLDSYEPPPMRGEEMDMAGILVVNDSYNANPMSMRASIRSFAEKPVVGVKWLALGDMLEMGHRGPDEHRALGAFVAKGSWAGLIVVGQLSVHTADGAVAAGFPEERVFRCRSVEDMGRTLASVVSPGDAVLVKASRGVRLEDAIVAFGRDREEVLV